MNTAPNVRIIPAKTQTAENRDKYHQLRAVSYTHLDVYKRQVEGQKSLLRNLENRIAVPEIL